MRNLLLIIISMIALTACSNNEQTASTNKNENPVQNEEKKKSVLDELHDFSMPLQTFVETYNESEREGFTSIEKDLSEIQFVDETNGYSKTLIDKTVDSTDYSLVAMFNRDKKFKRITYTQTFEDEVNEESIATLLALFDALEIDSNYVTEFLNTGNEDVAYETEDYTVSFKKMDSMGFLNIAIDSNH